MSNITARTLLILALLASILSGAQLVAAKEADTDRQSASTEDKQDASSAEQDDAAENTKETNPEADKKPTDKKTDDGKDRKKDKSKSESASFKDDKSDHDNEQEVESVKGDDDTATADAKQAKVRLAHIKIEGELPESPGQMSLFGDLGIDLRKTMERLEKAGDDKDIAGIVIEIGSASLPQGKLNELRESIHRVRAGGKKVYAQLESAMGPQLLLATACDEVVMPEAGVILIPGIRLEVAHFKDLLEKLGIEADMLHVGESKGAAEPLTRRNMSEPVRENLTALVEDFYDQMLTTLAADRELQIKEVRAIVDQGLLTATQAQEAGLIDRVTYPDVFRDHLQEQYNAEKLVYVVNYGKRTVDTDFSGPMGMMKLFQSILGASRKGNGDSESKLALVYAVGPITSGKSSSGPLGGEVMGSETIVEALRDAADDKSVKAIVLRINSPGGSALASDMIWRAIQSIDKPVIASMGDVAASGGYYISMGADRILAEPGTITGSIGVVGGKLAMRGLYDKLGISTDVIQRGENSGIFSTTSKFSEKERHAVDALMKDIYRLFTTKAAAGRGMSTDELEKLAGGQVYTGRIAKRKGLVDDTGTLRDALQLAKELGGLDPDKKYQLRVLPKPRNPLEELFGADMDAEKEVRLASGLSRYLPELAGPLQQAVVLRHILREPTALILPFHVEVK